MNDGLRVRGLSKRFGAKTAVDGLDFDVARGEIVLQPEIMARVLFHTPSLSGAAVPASSTPAGLELTRREQEVLAGVARGERSKEIVRRLGITERTVRAYLTNIYTKLNVDSRASAGAVALEHGLLPREKDRASLPLDLHKQGFS